MMAKLVELLLMVELGELLMMVGIVDITSICQSTFKFDNKSYRVIVDGKTWGATKDVEPSFVVKF